MLLPMYLSTRKHPQALYSPSCLGPLPRRMAVCGASPPSTLGWVRRAFLDLLRNQAERWLSASSPSDSESLYLLSLSSLLSPFNRFCYPLCRFCLPHSCLLLSSSSPPPCSSVSSSLWVYLAAPPSSHFLLGPPLCHPLLPPPHHRDGPPHQTPALLGLQWRGLFSHTAPPPPRPRTEGQGQLHGWATRAATRGSEGPELGLTPRSCGLEILSPFGIRGLRAHFAQGPPKVLARSLFC